MIGGDVWSDHDYIAAFKTDPEFTCKIALPTENIHDTTFALFAEAKIEGTYNYSDWNDSLFTKRLEKVEITGEPGHYRKAFDAYAIHPYYETKIMIPFHLIIWNQPIHVASEIHLVGSMTLMIQGLRMLLMA